MRRALTAVVIAAALFPTPVRGAPVPVIVVDGRGFGHGVGMAQDGAFWMGKQGATTEQILGQFYPGTKVAKGKGTVRVAVLDAGPAPASTVLSFPDGGEIRDAPDGPQSPGFPVAMAKGEQVRIVWDGGQYSVARVDGPVALGSIRYASARSQVGPLQTPTTLPTTTSPSTSSTTSSTSTTSVAVTSPSSTSTTSTTTAPPRESTTTTVAPPPSSSRSLWAVPPSGKTVTVAATNRRYRGAVEATGAKGTLRLLNQLDVEDYLKGMGEVRDPKWPPASLRAQATAARTYALRAMSASGEICDTQRCQVYLGADAEYGAMNQAVDATRGNVLVYGRSLASAVYSANGGGHSASREEGFGPVTGDLPYLRPAPYLTHDPAPWSTTIALSDVAGHLSYPGTITNVTVAATGPSGRATTLTLDGSAGPMQVQGLAFAAALGLRSTLFSVRIATAVVAPSPLTAGASVLQALPDDVAVATPTTEVTAPTGVERDVDPRVVRPSPASTTTTPEGLEVLAGWLAVAGLSAGVVLRPRRRRQA